MITVNGYKSTTQILYIFRRLDFCSLQNKSVKLSIVCSFFFPLFSGAIFHAGDEEYMDAFKKAVIDTKSEHIAPSFKVETSIKKVEVNTDSFKTAAAGTYEYVLTFFAHKF